MQQCGYTVVARNWRTKVCEIDIVAEYANTRYFVEVKYRSSNLQGGGVAAITPKKLQQMAFAATVYDQRYGTRSGSRLLAAIVEPSGSIELLEIL